jgi:uncharacterized protein HemX
VAFLGLGPITWKRQQQQPQQQLRQQEQQQMHQQRERQEQQQVLQQQEREQVQQLLPFCHKLPKQQQRSQQRVREFCSFVIT